ncbi:MAG: hypothetical protein QG630_65 [Patescibacteria group bacterium]|nr:hypothetical protein [Patescibacteria group bacterium]
MNRILSSKNLTKKIAIFFLVFFLLIFANTESVSAAIQGFGYGTDLTTCENDIAKCKIDPTLKKLALDNPNYKLENTDVNLDGNFPRTTFKLSDFNSSLDNFIKERLYRGKYGYFGNDIAIKFNYLVTEFSNFNTSFSAEETKTISLLWSTLTGNLETSETKLADAKFITKTLAGNDSGTYTHEDLQVATLIYYYLKIYLTIDKYITINKSLIPTDVQTKLKNVNNKLRETIYSELYKKDSILRADGCTTDGTNLDKCTIFSKGIFTVEGIPGTDNQTFDPSFKVNQLKLDASKDFINVNNTKSDPSIADADPNTRKAYGDNDKCTQTSFFSFFTDNSIMADPACSVGAYLINIIIEGINGLVNIIVDLAGALFDWVYNTGVINFKDWVEGSKAYVIYKTIILSLIVSLMTFLVFYLIIRRLIDDDGEKMNKILPRIIILALFVYFSFTITGWIIDESNKITIMIYRSMTKQDAKNPQGISDVLKKTLSIDNGGKNSGGTGIAGNFKVSKGDWDAVPFTLGQLAVSIVSVFVLFQGAILILSRTIILLLCMIFSPIMLFPDGLTEFTDKYKKLVMDNFTGNVLLGPVFMFLVLLAVQIGQVASDMVGSGPTTPGGAPEGTSGFLGGIISSVLVIVVLQLAISASKSLSGSMGEKLGGVIGKYAGKAGGLAFGAGKFVGGRALGGVMNNTKAGDKINDWITRGSTKSGIRGALFKGVKNYTNRSGLDGETKRNSEAENIANTHHKANEHTQLRIRTDLEKRAGNGDKTAKLALKQIDKKIEEKKNTEFKTSKETKEREAGEKNKNGEGNSTAKEVPNEYVGASSNIKTGQISKRDEKGQFVKMSDGLKQESKDQKDFIKNREDNNKNEKNEIVKHEYTPDNFTRNNNANGSSNNQNNGSGNQTVHTDNLQVVANNIQLMTGDKLVNRARTTNEVATQPKAYLSNGSGTSVDEPKPVILPNNSREEKNELGKQMKVNVNDAKKITSKDNQDIEYAEFEDIPVNK